MGGEADQVVWRGVRPVEGIRGIWPDRNATRVNKDAIFSGVGTTVVYTVPAGKLYFMSSGQLNGRLSADAAATVGLYIKLGVEPLSYRIFYQYHILKGQLSSAQSFVPALEVPAGYTIRIYCDHANLDGMGLIFGWLEDA